MWWRLVGGGVELGARLGGGVGTALVDGGAMGVSGSFGRFAKARLVSRGADSKSGSMDGIEMRGKGCGLGSLSRC